VGGYDRSGIEMGSAWGGTGRKGTSTVRVPIWIWVLVAIILIIIILQMT
jgi:hypothetical protein